MRAKQPSLLGDALEVRRACGKGLLEQAREIRRIRKRNPTLGATDYYVYRLYDPMFLGGSRPEDFLGGRSDVALAHALNLRPLVMPAWDKFSLAIVAHAFDLPVPRLRAVYRRGPAATSGVADVALDGVEALAHWLRTQAHWPIVAKPSYCQLGYGCHRFTGYRPSDDVLEKGSGESMPVEHFVRNVVDRPATHFYLPRMGYLFQDALHPHREIAELLGNETIVRLMLIQDEQGVEIVGAGWKLATGAVGAHNERGNSIANLTAGIDVDTGRLGKVLKGHWPNAEVVTTSPATQRPFEGFVIPHWQEVVALCTRAARVFPLLRMQHWDIVVTDDGPFLLELHDEGPITAPQLWGRGLLTDRLRALLRDGAYGNAFAWLGPPSA